MPVPLGAPACSLWPAPDAPAMNLRFVEAYYWVVLLRSVTRAAEKLHLTQSALSLIHISEPTRPY